ncbi:MAG: DUF2125 domain-containing protein [Hyphomonadaceae bacterium]|nr:DUF2125 domain-containing protein [Hyphomonadaceae bacterium]
MSARAAPRAPRAWLIIAWATFALIAIGWTLYWRMLETQARDAIAAFVAAQNARGGEAQIGAVSARGFPRVVALTLSDVRFAPQDRAWRARTATLEVHVNPGNPAQSLVIAPTPIAVTYASGATRTFAAADARMSLHVGRSGGVERLSLDLVEARWSDAATQGPRWSMRRLLAHLRPDPRAPSIADARHQLALDIEGWALAAPLRPFEGLGAQAERVKAAIALTHADAALGGLAGDALAAWRDAGGEAGFEHLEARWGAGQFSGAGALRLDAQRRLHGRLSVGFETPRETLAALAASPSLSPRAVESLRTLSAAQAEGAAFETLLEFREGVVIAGGVAVREAPPLY